MTHANSTTSASPKVILQPGALFFQTPEGELWRVHDTDQKGASRAAPSANLGVKARLFVAIAGNGLALIHHFPAQSSRAVDASALLAQLDTAATI
jgi:hypothetical protein